MTGPRLARSETLGSVRRASDLTDDVAGLGQDRFLPVLPELRELLPGRGLRRGSTIAIGAGGQPAGSGARRMSMAGATSLMLALLAGASRAGSWCAVIGMPSLGLVAADEVGIALDRLALVPTPGPEWHTVAAALLDGFDVVVVAPAGPVAPAVRLQLAARARQRGSVLIPFCLPAGRARPTNWEGADVTLSPAGAVWSGLGQGHGRLRSRELTVASGGRGAAGRPRRATMWLPHVSWLVPQDDPVRAPRPADDAPVRRRLRAV